MSIFSEGYTIERENGEIINLSSKEISDIYRKIKALFGRDSVTYYLDAYDEEYDTDEAEIAKIVEEMENDDRFCAEVWDAFEERIFYESGYEERAAVIEVAEDYIRERKEENK